MRHTSRRHDEFTEVMRRYADTVLRVCTLYLHRRADAEDAFQETFIKYAKADVAFADEEHRKAWLIRVAANTCKDVLKSAAARTQLIGEDEEFAFGEAPGPALEAQAVAHLDVSEALRQIDGKYRLPLYLRYFEGYKAKEIAGLLGMPENTVYTNMARGKEKLKEVLSRGGA